MITHDEAFAATSTDPHAYPGLNPNNYTEEDLNKRRESAAQAIMQGIAANDQYWNSRSQLEALQARADGHSVVVNGDTTGTDPNAHPAVRAADADSTTVESSESPQIEAAAGTEEVTDATVVPEENQSDVDKLRAQLRNAGITPEA